MKIKTLHFALGSAAFVLNAICMSGVVAAGSKSVAIMTLVQTILNGMAIKFAHDWTSGDDKPAANGAQS